MKAATGFETERLLLRAWRDEDAADFAAMNADPRVMEFFPAPLDQAASDALLEKIRAHHAREGFGLFAVCSRADHGFLGFTGLSIPAFQSDFTPCVEIGWRFRAEAWGRGYASEAARACLQLGFGELALNEIVSFTSVMNDRSIAVMKRIGMEFDREFDHPALAAGDPLRRHVLYRIQAPAASTSIKR